MIDERIAYELTFRRCRESRFLSHLDNLRALARALRRTGLPIYFSEGFNPKPRISYLTPPLAVGHTSECERIRFRLMEDMDAAETEARIAASLPPGMVAASLRKLPRAVENANGDPVKDKPSTAPIEYFIFLRKETPPAPGDLLAILQTDAEAAYLKARATTETDAAGVLLFSDEKPGAGKSAAFINEYFAGGIAIVIPGGPDYKRPEKQLAALTELDPLSLFCHRKKEV